jgi:hypothetical protein
MGMQTTTARNVIGGDWRQHAGQTLAVLDGGTEPGTIASSGLAALLKLSVTKTVILRHG